VRSWLLVALSPLILVIAFFMFKATQACLQGSFKAPFYIGAIYITAYLVIRRIQGSWKTRLIEVGGLGHTCLAFSLTLRANYPSNILPLIPVLALATSSVIYAILRAFPPLTASAVLNWFAAFTGSRFRLIAFLKITSHGDAEALLAEAWKHNLAFTIEAYNGEVILSVTAEARRYSRAVEAVRRRMSWLEEALKTAGFTFTRVEGWIEVERLLYAPIYPSDPNKPSWRGEALAPAVGDGEETGLFLKPSGEGWTAAFLSRIKASRRGGWRAVRRSFEHQCVSIPYPSSTLKSFLTRALHSPKRVSCEKLHVGGG